MKLACVKIHLLGRHSFTDGFLLLVIPHNARWRLDRGRDLLSLFIFLFFFLREQFHLEKNLCTILFVWLSCCFFFCAKGKKRCVFSGVIHDPGWMLQFPKGHGGWTPPCRAVRDWSPQELHLSFPSSCRAKGDPHPHSLSAHLIRKTFPGTRAQNKSSSDSRSETWEGKAERSARTGERWFMSVPTKWTWKL